MLNEFVEKIVVHERDRKGSADTAQKIEIYFNFIGEYIPPTMTETVVVFFRAVITIWNNQPLLKAWKLSVNILGSLLPLLMGEKSQDSIRIKRSEMKCEKNRYEQEWWYWKMVKQQTEFQFVEIEFDCIIF